MQTPQPLRFKANLRTFKVLDTKTGQLYQCTGLMDTANLRSRLEREHKAPVVTSAKKQRRLMDIAEQRSGGR